MNRERTRNGKPISDADALVNAESGRARLTGRVLLIMSMAVISGVAVALLWLNQVPRGSLEMLPDGVAQATASVLPIEPSVEENAAESDVVEANVPEGTSAENIARVGFAAAANGSSTIPLAAQSEMAQSEVAQSAPLTPVPQVTLAPHTPTPTLTPMPSLDKVDSVVAIGEVTLFDAGTGLVVGTAPQGARFTATARSTDGQWLYGTLEDSSVGWASVDQLIVFDAARLRVEDVVITPIVATSIPVVDAAVPTAQATAQVASQGAGDDTPILRPTPVAGDTPVAQVTLQDSRLNLRAGPASSYPIIAKALPNESFAILGRDASAAWLQLALPDVIGGFGWAAAEFLHTDAAIADLPVSTELSSASAYQEGASETKGGQPPVQTQPAQAEPTKVASQGALSATANRNDAPAVSPSSAVTGLSGKLAIQTTWGGDIYIYDFATGELRLLTGGFDPAISPDGTQVAFTRIGGEHGLYVINIDGTNERKIFSERTHFLSPKWSPDGQYILFERGDEFWNCTLANPDDAASACYVGREPENATEVQQKLARVDVNGNNYQDIPVLVRARAADWHSAGIVYQSPGGIQLTQDKPGVQTELVFFNIRKQYELDPDLQPNGGQVIFQRRENDHWEIYRVQLDGGGLTALTRPNFTLVEKLPSNVAPAWSPDGKHIVFLSNRQPNQSAGAWNVWVMDADGSNQHQLDINLPFTYTYVAEQMLDWGR